MLQSSILRGSIVATALPSDTEDIRAAMTWGAEAAWWRQIYEAGATSRSSGGSLSDCPRRPFTVAAVIWLSGFTGSSMASISGTA